MSDLELLLLVESRKKSGWIAALLNFFLIGCGFFYLGKWGQGIFMMAFTLGLFAFDLPDYGFAMMIVMFIEGFFDANTYNKDLITEIIKEKKELAPASGA